MDAALHPIHFSLAGKRRLPRNMDRIIAPRERVDDLTKVALSIFVDCSNSAVPFQDALLAVYLSGLQHGSAIAEGTDDVGA